MNIWIYILIGACAIISGMGMGGGSIFLMLQVFLANMPQKEAQFLSLIMFIAVGVSASIYNIKKKTFDKSMFFKIIVFMIIGAIIGANITKNISDEVLKLLFYSFMAIIGIYEIISSVKSLKKGRI